MLLKYICFCFYINLKYLIIHDYTDLIQHFDAFHACCSDDFSIKCLYIDHKTFILLVDNVVQNLFAECDVKFTKILIKKWFKKIISSFLCVQSIHLKSFLIVQMMTTMLNLLYRNKHILFKYIVKRWLIQSRNVLFMISSMTLKRSFLMIEKIIDAYKRKLRFIFCI